MMCQGCVDRGILSQATYAKIENFKALWSHAQFGAGHVVLEDCNVWDSHIQECLEELGNGCDCCSQTEKTAVGAFLRELLAIPEDDR